MLSRRHLRIKVLQALYAFFQSEGHDIAVGEKQLIFSTDKLYELYIHQLSFLVKLSDYVHNRIDEAKKKFYPTAEDLNPNTRFIDSRFILQIEENKDFKRLKEKLKINWGDEENIFHKLYQDLKMNPDYLEIVNRSQYSYKDDKDLVMLIVTNFLPELEILRNYYEDRNIFWADEDFDISIMMLIKTIEFYKENWGPDHRLPPLFKEDKELDETEEDRQFMIKLFRYSVVTK